MSEEENVELLRRYMRSVWDEGNPDAVKEFASESFLRHGSPLARPLDRAQQIERLRGFRTAFPDIQIVVEDVVTDDDHIAFRSTMTGTHLGDFMGIRPTGRQVTVRLVDVVRVEDGKFAEQWGGPDMLDLLRQLGATVELGSLG